MTMDDRLWTPPSAKVKPTVMKKEGGSHFDDEVMDIAIEQATFAIEVERLIDHLRKRPDHKVYVSSTEERTKMREVFNLWFKVSIHCCQLEFIFSINSGIS